MNRREFLQATSLAGVALAAVSAAAGEETATPARKTGLMAPPCGLYCGICGEYAKGECHGCGCDCGACKGKWHEGPCQLSQCVKRRGLESCAECPDLPCTKLIQFALDPVWGVQAPCLENLRRRQKIGKEAWLREQEAYWQDPEKRAAWLRFDEECRRKWREISGEA